MMIFNNYWLASDINGFIFFCKQKKSFLSLPTENGLTDGVTVALQFLELSVQVRILVGQHTQNPCNTILQGFFHYLQWLSFRWIPDRLPQNDVLRRAQFHQFMQLFLVKQSPDHRCQSLRGTKEVHILRDISHIGG